MTSQKWSDATLPRMEARSFIDSVLDKVYTTDPGDWSKKYFVVPTHRAGYALRMALAARLDKPQWAPRINTLPGMLWELSGMNPHPRHVHHQLLYESLRELEGDAAEPFASFMKWGPVVLSDFEDAALALADTSLFFRNLREVKEIENWSLGENELGLWQEGYLHFWQRMTALHEKFKANAMASGQYTYGLMLQHLAQQAELKLPAQQFVFAGLSHFAPAEWNVVDKLAQSGIAEIYVDADRYYLNAPLHEAASCIRRITQAAHVHILDAAAFDSVSKCVEVHYCTSSLAQIAVLAGLLEKRTPEELAISAIVVADTKLEPAIVQLLGQQHIAYRDALRKPVSRQSDYRFLTQWLALCLNNEPRHWHHEKLRRLLAAPLCGIPTALQNDINHWLTISGYTYLDLQKREQLVNEFRELKALPWIAKPVNSSSALLEMALAMIENAPRSLLRARMAEVLRSMQQQVAAQNWLQPAEALPALLADRSEEMQVHKSHDPADGLLLASLTETVALDFETVIVMGAAEKNLPGNMYRQSYIPHDLRHLHGLSTTAQREEVAAWMFYRLVQRARQIHLLYSTDANDYHYNEPSRYIIQLKAELNTLSSGHALREVNHYMDTSPEQVLPFAQNDALSRKRLDELLELGLSPSAIHTYIKCPLDFYYKYIAGMGESDEVEEQLSDATFGSVVHYALETMFQPFVGSFPQSDDLNQMTFNLDESLRRAWEHEAPGVNHHEGIYMLANQAMRQMLMHYLKNEAANAPSETRILEVEKTLEYELNARAYGWNKTIKLTGKADRIDQRNNHTCIIDFKTGAVKPEDVKTGGDMHKLFAGSGKPKAIQLLLYILCWCREKKTEPEQVRAALYSLARQELKYQWLNEQASVTENELREFEAALVEFVKGIYECETFTHNPKAQHCEYCITEKNSEH